MIRRTDTDWAPWTYDHRATTRNAPASHRDAGLPVPGFEYDGKDAQAVGSPDPKIVQRGIDAVGD